ncbi:hypothetical protein EGW08_013383 [Elysia chlorotica]|uniref:C2H2-type domain-containing protein n=1 Tax=Elysia chlorotica TaxID=188477 RepID=A0A433TB81_ELYCH|nr:hypothetical protein EGW08_013383 [Elysia chlorotica]
MPTEAGVDASTNGTATPDAPNASEDQKSSENGVEPGGDNKSGSDMSDVEMDDSLSKAGSEHNPDQDVKEEDDNSLVVFHCWLCSVEFIDKVSIIRHLQEWHKDKPEVHNLDRLMKVPLCMECGVQGPCEHQDGERHEEDDGASAYMCRPRFLTCRTCPEQFLNAEAVRIHRAKEHPEEPSHQCTYCQEAFLDHPSLVSHNRIHLGGRPYICTTCGNRFSKLSDLKRHERIHSGEKPFKCMQCYQTFTQKSSLEKHARIHARRSGNLACLLCGLVFKEKEGLMEHAQEMHKGSNFTCEICGKMYTEERYLILHEKTHTDNSDNLKPFACTFCDRRFSSQHLLSKHEKKMHLSKREIKCHLCHKLFKRNENLTRHMLSHSGVKNFQCPECGVGFTEKGSLTRHFKAQHQQLRPHSCPICRRSFTRKSLVRKHVERFHVQKARELVSQRGKFFRCRLCLKLLRKTGKRQHERHHRSKGDAWEGSLEEKLDGGVNGETDLDSLLGPDVAKLLKRKDGDDAGAEDDDGAEDEDEDENDEDDEEADEDKNEDEDDEENYDDEDDKTSSIEGEEEKYQEEEIQPEPQKPEEAESKKRKRQSDGPVFPQFKHPEANDSEWRKSATSNDFSDLPEDSDLSNYRKVGVVESAPAKPTPRKRRTAMEPTQYVPANSQSQNREEEEARNQRGAPHQFNQAEMSSGRSDSMNLDQTGSAFLTQRLLSKTENQDAAMRPQKVMNERSPAPLADPHPHYSSSRREDPASSSSGMAEDLRLQQGFGNPREAQLSDPPMFDSRSREERASSSQHHGSEDHLGSYPDSRHHGSTKDLQYMDESAALARAVNHRGISNPPYPDQGSVGEPGYHDVMNSYQRMSQADSAHYSRETYPADLKEQAAYARHQGRRQRGPRQ